MQFSRYDSASFDAMMIKGHEPFVSLSQIIFYKKSGILLCSHIVTNVVFSAGHVLTVVFGMGTGVTHDRIDTGQIIFFPFPSKINYRLTHRPLLFS